MSDAYECDACGELRSGEPANTLKVTNAKDGAPIVGGSHIIEGKYEICEACGKRYKKDLNHCPEWVQ